MHLKNWTVLYPDKRTPVLSPAYDLVATLPYIAGDQLALNFGDSRSMSEISPDQIRRFADTARLPMSPVAQLVMETVERTAAAWKALEEKELLSGDMKKAIENQIQTVAANSQRLYW
jgi:serine/threonine-protein kinase HipA